MEHQLRQAGPADQRVIDQALAIAANWAEDEPAGRPDDPVGLKYAAGFGKPGDHGRIAELASRPAGAIWWRHFTQDDSGYGFVDEQTPELSLAVWPQHRQQGLGRALLQALKADAISQRVPGISLSVEPENPARLLYASEGFHQVGSVENAWTMVWRPE